MSETESEADDVWQQQLEELGEKLNAESDRTGFLRMVNRNHIYNSSNYSLSSLFSLSTSLNGFTAVSSEIKFGEGNESGPSSKTPVSALYDMLIQPMMESMLNVTEMVSGTPDLVLVLQGDLFLIPFPILRSVQAHEYLFEKFNLMVVPSITSLHHAEKLDKHGRPLIDSSGAIVVGNPKLPPSVRSHWLFKELPGTEYEANIVAELLTSRPMIGQDATKEAILQEIQQVEVVHFATHISWRLSAIVLTPSEIASSPQRYHHSVFDADDLGDNHSDISSIGGPCLSDFLLTAADILNLKLHAKLVVLSSGYTDERAGRINADGVVGLTRALLSAGAQCVLYSLWPVPDNAAKLLMRTLYTSLQQGTRVSQALSQAIKIVQTTRQFSHPSNWGGWVLVGRNVKLSSKVALMGHAICELLQYPGQCREAMRVLLHLIEKSLQRIHQGIKTSMYTTYQSVENKVGRMNGWKDLLQAVGFRFDTAKNTIPSAVFFPHTDPGDRLTQASASLQALLGLPANGLQALSKFLSNYEAGEALLALVREVLGKLTPKEFSVQVPINVKLWQVEGVHEFLASLGFDLVDVGKDEVTLRMGKQANRRHLQFALQSLVAVFDTQEAPRTLTLDSSSSLESLSSSHSSSTSTSTFSKGSSPPVSPRGRKKSLFNPAEMEKVRSIHKNHLLNQGGLVGRAGGLKTSAPNPSLYLSHQSRIRSMYRGNSIGVEEFCMDDSSSQGSSPVSFLGDLQELPEKKEVSFHVYDQQTGLSSYMSGNAGSGKIDPIARSNGYSSSSQSEAEDISERTVIVHPEHEELHFRRNSLGSQSSSTLTSKSSHGNSVVETFSQTLPNKDMFYNLDNQAAGSGSVHVPAEIETSREADLEHSGNIGYDPEQIAKMVLAEVGKEKQAVESMQKVDLMKAQQTSLMLRRQYSDSSSNAASPTSLETSTQDQVPKQGSAFKNVANSSASLASPIRPTRVSPSRSSVVQQLNFHCRQDSGHGRSCPTTSGSESDREPETHRTLHAPSHPGHSDSSQSFVGQNSGSPGKVPPPIPNKPNVRTWRGTETTHNSVLQRAADPRQKVYDTSVDSTDSGIVDDKTPNHIHLPNSSGKFSEPLPTSPRREQALTAPNLPSQQRTSVGIRGVLGPKPFSRPQLRPESSASTSSQCSTTSSSSVQTVIYRPPERKISVVPKSSRGSTESAQARLNASRVRFYSENGYSSSDTDVSFNHRGGSVVRPPIGFRKNHGSVDSSDSESVDSYTAMKPNNHRQRRYSAHQQGWQDTNPHYSHHAVEKQNRQEFSQHYNKNSPYSSSYSSPASVRPPPRSSSYPHPATGDVTQENYPNLPRGENNGSYQDYISNSSNYTQKHCSANQAMHYENSHNSTAYRSYQEPQESRSEGSPRSYDQSQQQTSHSYSSNQDHKIGWPHEAPPSRFQSRTSEPPTDHRSHVSGHARTGVPLQTLYTERAHKALPEGAVLQSSKC